MNPLAPEPTPNSNAPGQQWVIFPIGNLSCALPIAMVGKIVVTPKVECGGLQQVGVMDWEGQELTILDLHQRLFHRSLLQTINQQQKGYLVLTRNSQGEQFAIPCLAAPTITTVPPEQIRVLPESFRQADSLAIARYVAIVPGEDGQKKTVFLLDVDQILTTPSV